jgi:hypothetical protein
VHQKNPRGRASAEHLDSWTTPGRPSASVGPSICRVRVMRAAHAGGEPSVACALSHHTSDRTPASPSRVGVAQATDPDRLTGLRRSFCFACRCESESEAASDLFILVPTDAEMRDFPFPTATRVKSTLSWILQNSDSSRHSSVSTVLCPCDAACAMLKNSRLLPTEHLILPN